MAAPARHTIPNLARPGPVNGIPQWGKANNMRSGTAIVNPFIKSLFGGGVSAPGAPAPQANPYAGILNEFLNQTKANFAAQSAADAASRDSALRRLLVSYGGDIDPAMFGGNSGYLKNVLDPKTRELMAKNTAEGTSVFARTQAENNKATRLIPAQLAARGMLRSGQTGSDLQEQAQAYKNTQFDQVNELLGASEGTIGNFLSAERARQDALAQAQLQAQMAAAQEYGGDMYGDAPSGAVDTPNLFGTPTRTAAPKQKLYQAQGPYGPYGPAKYTLAQVKKMNAKRR